MKVCRQGCPAKRSIVMKKRILSLFIITAMCFSIIGVTEEPAKAASKARYWLKVNRLANVVTVYKFIKGRYRPYRAMVCSTGGSNTPLGTFYTKNKQRWGVLMGSVYGQFHTRIVGSYLFHSVWYYRSGNPATVSARQYNMLGKSISHGCVRLSVMDVKWIYENCKVGTKVTIYSSRTPGPLGKPKALKVKGAMCWDPTDPNRRNPDFRIKNPRISISKKKKKTASYGSRYNLKSGVTAKNINAYQSLTSKVRVAAVKKYKKGRWAKAKFSTKSIGTYKVTYRCRDKYCGRKAAYKSLKISVVDYSKPSIRAPDKRIVATGDEDAFYGVTARQKSCNLTKAVITYVKAPEQSSYTKVGGFSAAKKYKFTKAGEYVIKYVVRSKYKKSRLAVKTVSVYVYDDAIINIKTDSIRVKIGDKIDNVKKKVKEATEILDAGKKVPVEDNMINIIDNDHALENGGKLTIEIKYEGLNGRLIKETREIESETP